MKKPIAKAIIGGSVTVIIFGGALLLIKSNNTAVSSPPNMTISIQESRKPSILSRGVEIKSLSYDDFSKLINNFKNNFDPRVAKTDIVLNDGETVVTNGYEEESGSFIFSAMTPSFAVSPAGESKINVRLERFHVALGSKIETGLSKTVSTDPGHSYGVGYANEWGRTNERSYEIDILTNVDKRSGKIRLKAKEYQLHEPGAYAE